MYPASVMSRKQSVLFGECDVDLARLKNIISAVQIDTQTETNEVVSE